MKTFDEIYNELQSDNNSELNTVYQEAKKESEKGNKIAKRICLIIDIILVIMILSQGISIKAFFSLPVLIYIGFLVFFVCIINIIVFGIVNMGYSKNRGEYQKQYKLIVVNKLMSNFYNDLEYFPEKEMPEYIYNIPNYESGIHDIYRSEDYMEANIKNQYSIQMAEVHTKDKREYKDSEGETKTEIITIFHGLFAKVVMHKSIMGDLRITQNGSLMFDKNLEMDSSEFEKYFDVKASDKILGMRILTHDVMEELIEFENKTNMKFDIYINKNELYLRFHSGDMFEPGNFENGALDKETIRKYFYMLNLTYNLSNKIIEVVEEIEI